MAIHVRQPKVHWNYFLAFESDLITLARYIEFRDDNFKTYSIELARLLMAASSEVDVVAKLVCKQLQPDSHPRNIMQYASIILAEEPKLNTFAILIPRFGLTLKPWSSWTQDSPPLWWSAYNGVKHHRDTRFAEANLENTLNSVAALFFLTVKHYSLFRQHSLHFGDGTVRHTPGFLTTDQRFAERLQPESQLFRFRSHLGNFSEISNNEG